MQIICFEDDIVDQLRPITLARPAYAITCASFSLIEWLQKLPGEITVSIRSHLREIEQLDRGLDSVTKTDDPEGVLIVNARLVPSLSIEASLKKLVSETQSTVVMDSEDGSVLAARLVAGDCEKFEVKASDSESSDPQSIVDALIEIAKTKPVSKTQLGCFRWPHDVVQSHMAEMVDAMEWRVANGNYTQRADGVFCGEGVEIGEYASIDTSAGAIVLDDGVRVGPFSYLSGPVYAGKHSRIIEHAALKDGVALGHTVKIGGEVEASVIEPYTNKQHHGFLGHSYLGSWINLGAGTCNSDLKNTYGKINIQYGEEKIATGMQFLGCIMGDYSKTAINTSIFTGKVIGVCSMLYGFATSNVPSFVNYATLFGQSSLLPVDVMISTQARMFARRKVEQRDCDKQLIESMYNLTGSERAASEQFLM